MNFAESWEHALKKTRIHKERVRPLETFAATKLSYLLLSESVLGSQDTVARSGEINVEKPAILLPSASPQFEGFDLDDKSFFDPAMITNLLLVRGVVFPSLRYAHKSGKLEIFEGDLPKARAHYMQDLERKEDVATSLLEGPSELWQFSLLILVAQQVAKSAEGDVRNIFEKYRKQKWF